LVLLVHTVKDIHIFNFCEECIFLNFTIFFIGFEHTASSGATILCR